MGNLNNFSQQQYVFPVHRLCRVISELGRETYQLYFYFVSNNGWERGRRNIIFPIIVQVRSEIRLSGKVNQGNKDLSNSLLFEGSCNLSGFKDLLCSPLDNLCHSTFILTRSRNPVKDKFEK